MTQELKEGKVAKTATKEVQRLDKIVAHLTGLSRQNATALIKSGDVLVDNEVVLNAAGKININSTIVIAGFNDAALDEDENGVALKASEAFAKRVFMLNKPYNFVCADRDKNHSTVQSIFRNELNVENLHCAGRLDIDTTGLLIVTDDGDLNHEITSPKKSVDKVYLARLDSPVPPSAVKSFLNGIKHPEEKKRYQSAKLTILATEGLCADEHWAAVQLSEGRYHEVKRLFEMVGCQVVELARVAIGSLTLNEEQSLCEYVRLSSEEIEALFANHDYTSDELLALLERYKDNVLSSRLAYVPTSYQEQLKQSSLGEVNTDSQDNNANNNEFDEEIEDEIEDEYESDSDNFDDLDENGDLRIY